MADGELEILPEKHLNIVQGQIMGKKRRDQRRSRIWCHFLMAESKTRAKCHYCSSSISITGGTGGNLIRHLRKKHPNITWESAENVKRVSGVTISSSELPQISSTISLSEKESTNNSSTSFLNTAAEQASIHSFMDIERLTIEKKILIDEQLAKMICKGFYPFSFVEGAEFKSFVQMLNPEYQLPSKKTISNEILPSLYKESKNLIEQALNSAPAVCLTTDGWTSPNNTSFLTLTAHYLTSDTELKLHSSLLSCKEFVETPTAGTISDWLITITAGWHIGNKIVGIVTDNAINMADAISLCNWHHIHCFANSVNLVVQKGLLEVDEIVHKVRATVHYLKQNLHSSSKLEEMGLSQMKLKLDVRTSWYSTYEMLQKFFKNKDYILSAIFILGSESEKFNFDDDEWIIIEFCIHILHPFVEAIKEVGVEETVTISKISILPRIIIKKLNSVSDDPRIVKMKEVMIDEVCVQFLIGDGGLENHPIVAQAVFLDPRFKKHGFSSEDKFNEVENAVKEELQSMQVTYCSEKPSIVGTSPSSLWEEFDKSVQEISGEEHYRAANIIEVDKYLEEPLLPRQMNPLSWWFERKAVYPRLYELMLQSLCVPVTSIPCRHMFSKVDFDMNERKAALNSSKLEMMVFLNHNK